MLAHRDRGGAVGVDGAVFARRGIGFGQEAAGMRQLAAIAQWSD